MLNQRTSGIRKEDIVGREVSFSRSEVELENRDTQDQPVDQNVGSAQARRDFTELFPETSPWQIKLLHGRHSRRLNVSNADVRMQKRSSGFSSRQNFPGKIFRELVSISLVSQALRYIIWLEAQVGRAMIIV
jgi:hypothetical protein